MKLSRWVRTAALVSAVFLASGVSSRPALAGQDAAQTQHAPLDQVLGTVTAANTAEKTFTVREDKTNTEYSVSAASARRFLRVPPGEKDLKKAQPMDESQIAVGDRLLARGHKDASQPKLDASIVIVMTAGDLQQKHEAEVAEWQKRGSRGVVASVDEASHQITMTQRVPEGTKTVTVVTTPETQFTRYSPTASKSTDVSPSAFSDVKVGDQLRVLGNSSEDGAKLTAEKIWSGSFRTVAATIVSLSPDGKSLKATDLQTKKPVEIVLADDSSVRRIPPEMANMLAMRMNPNSKRQGAPEGSRSGPPPIAEGANPNGHGEQGGAPGGPEGQAGGMHGSMRGSRAGDLSQVIERLPKISLSELKPGDAVVISGAAGDDKSQLTATSVIAGVEPILTAAPSRGQSSALGNWNLDVGVPGQ